MGIGLTLAAWFCFSLVDTGAKYVALVGLPAVQVAFFRYAGHLVIATVLIARDPPDRLWPDHAGIVFLRGALLVAATLSNFWILSVLPLTAGQETLPQLRQLMGADTPRRRVR